MSALVVGLCPALAFACEDEATVKVIHAAPGVVKVKMVCKESAVTAIVNDAKCTVKVINTQGAHRSGWEPGHLIEPDSMKLGPGDDLKAPDTEQWVKISSRAGVIRFHRYPWSGKKTEGRTLQQYGPYRS